MRHVINADDKHKILQETKAIFDQSSILLVTGFLRYFKTTSVLDWAIKQPRRVIYVARTHKTADESISKSEEQAQKRGRQVVTLRGKHQICKRIRQHLTEDDELSYELLKVKFCYNCPYRPGRSNPITKDTIADIQAQDIINPEVLDEYYDLGMCPAEVALIAAEKFDAIFMPYAWMHFIKDVSGGRLNRIFQDSVLIFDEARHLMEYGVDQETIGTKLGGEIRLPLLEELNEFIKWFKPIADKFKALNTQNKRKRKLKTSSQMVVKCVEYLIEAIPHLISGWSRDFSPLAIEELEGAIKFLEFQLLNGGLNPKESEMIEKVLIRLLWMKKHHKSRLFIDFNNTLQARNEDFFTIDLTARKPKDVLASIIEEADKTLLIDSTPPPTKWSELWLGKDFGIDELWINPKSKPDIKVWVENCSRRWSYMYRHANVMDMQYAYLNKVLFATKEPWIISCRSKREAQDFTWAKEFGHEVIYQGGRESEGVQLTGNHLLTGLQYIYNGGFESQREYILEKLGKHIDDDEAWDDYLKLQTYQVFIQQLFRTFYHDRSARMVLLGVRLKEIEGIKRIYPYMDFVDFSYVPHNHPIIIKLRTLEDFLTKDKYIEDYTDYLRQKILENFELNSVPRKEIYKFFKCNKVKEVKKALDEMGWRGSGRGMRKF